MPMANEMINFDVVREIALKLPDVEESSIHGGSSLKLRGKLLACPAIHKSAELDTLAIRIDLDQRAKLLATQPSVYYVTPHYEKHPTVLVRLSRIDRESLKKLLELAWRSISLKTKPSGRKDRGRSQQTTE